MSCDMGELCAEIKHLRGHFWFLKLPNIADTGASKSTEEEAQLTERDLSRGATSSAFSPGSLISGWMVTPDVASVASSSRPELSIGRRPV